MLTRCGLNFAFAEYLTWSWHLATSKPWSFSVCMKGVAGCCAKTTIAPLDRVKILLQAHNHHYKHLGKPILLYLFWNLM